MENIKTHIFSFDRPAQLELLLHSISEFDIKQQLKVTVQFAYSNNSFQHGYEVVKSQFPKVLFLEEKRFDKPKFTNPLFGALWFNILLWLRSFRFRKTSCNFRKLLLKSLADDRFKYFMFLTDDSLFYREIEINEDILKMVSNKPGSAFTLSMGKNIEGGKYNETNNHIVWNTVQKPENNIWTYPFSVDGRIYEIGFLKKVVNSLLFTNPNTFEGVMVFYNKYTRLFSEIFANHESCLVGFELNQVQNQYNNNHIGVEQKIINDFYLMDYKLDLGFDKTKIKVFRPEISHVLMYNKNKHINLLKTH